MGILTDDMTRLRDDIGALRQRRFAFLGQLRQDVAELQSNVEAMRSRFCDQHGAMARGMNDGLGAFVSALKANVSQTTETFRSDRSEMARTLRAELNGFVSDIREYVDAMADQVFDLQQGFRDDRAAMARRLMDELQASSLGLSTGVTRMIEGFFSQRAEMAEKTQAGLRAFIDELKEGVSSLSRETGGMRASFRSDHADMAHRLKDKLGDFVSALRERASQAESDFREDRGHMAREGQIDRAIHLSEVRECVGELKHRVRDMRAAFATDVENAHRAWAGTPAPLRRKEEAAAEKAEECTPDDPGREEAPAEKAKECAPDDLTQITGIGPGRQGRLNAAGILTFQQLAASTSKALGAALGNVAKARPADMEKWIEQAKALV